MIKKIRKKSNLFTKIPVSLIILIFALYRIETSENAKKFGVEVFVYSIVIFGIFVKALLAYVFPEIILDQEIIKFIGRSKLKWSATKSIKITEVDNEISIVIEKFNSKKIIEHLKDLNTNQIELEKLIRKFAPNIDISPNLSSF
ncbi:hypothetical protein [Frigoriflavimonas asaccharolytica]|uniref:Uncharacterized protein n=1 Tax=Frigoriflavimonas asaccharolytica TaxID=2735899 RepID=A0A8J8K7X7_9FLAO|nr:hypothetical protein [Frigoriflavimonas asaccharolytica]NRS91981.1 hypothetical protein [Frigoriflavimonas asaccharolytica]